jgi:hypothetical protein
MKPVSGQEAELSAKVEILNSQLQGWSGIVSALYEPKYVCKVVYIFNFFVCGLVKVLSYHSREIRFDSYIHH